MPECRNSAASSKPIRSSATASSARRTRRAREIFGEDFMKDFVQWTTPSPLWETAISQSTAVERRAELSRPTILRFATDSFMDDFMRMLANDPKKLNQYIVLPETWRGISPPPEKTP